MLPKTPDRSAEGSEGGRSVHANGFYAELGQHGTIWLDYDFEAP